MKLLAELLYKYGGFVVASHAEAWIEIYRFLRIHLYGKVASHAEAWIEIGPQNRSQISAQSPPTRRRGLKL